MGEGPVTTGSVSAKEWMGVLIAEGTHGGETDMGNEIFRLDFRFQPLL